jgi:hypothetical protein
MLTENEMLSSPPVKASMTSWTDDKPLLRWGW